MSDWLDKIVCRFFGKSCTPERPSSKDITAELDKRGRAVDASTAILRFHRRNIGQDTSEVLDGMAIDVSSQWRRETNHAGVD